MNFLIGVDNNYFMILNAPDAGTARRLAFCKSRGFPIEMLKTLDEQSVYDQTEIIEVKTFDYHEAR